MVSEQADDSKETGVLPRCGIEAGAGAASLKASFSFSPRSKLAVSTRAGRHVPREVLHELSNCYNSVTVPWCCVLICMYVAYVYRTDCYEVSFSRMPDGPIVLLFIPGNWATQQPRLLHEWAGPSG
ncbi:unnamed protein product, partial [Iphiclides podalirius]